MSTYEEEIIQQVWEKGIVIPGKDPDTTRKDACGAWISRHLYGSRADKYNNGWEIDHIHAGGSDNISNLRPLQWFNNVSRQDGPLTCPVKAKL